MRHVVDESALTTLAAADAMQDHLGLLADLLLDLRRERESVAVISSWATVPIGDVDVGTFLSTTSAEARDSARLLMSLLDKCPKWDDDDSLYVEPEVEVNGEPWSSYGVALAGELVSQGRAIGCVTLGCSHGAGHHTVSNSSYSEEVVFITSASDCKYVHRQRLRLECPTEVDYFTAAEKAFPELVLAPNLTFRRFEGSYSELRDEVTRHLGILNDDFVAAYDLLGGHLDRVGTEIGLDISNEGNTRSSERLMRLRDVVIDGATYRCEMHTKIERHRNRIHIALAEGDGNAGRRVVVGIFVDHLRT